MKYLQPLTIFILSFLFHGCFIGADGDREKIVGNYYIYGEYGFKNVHLGYEDTEWGGIGLIEKPITAIGLNDKYIIVKREKDSLEYYVLRISDSGNHSVAEKNIKGPMTEYEFNKIIKELNLQRLSWTKKFEK